VTEQLEAFEQLLRRNPVVVAIVDRMPVVGLADCWLTAGALFQTVWNVLSDRDPTAGILDYDLNYFDDTNLSWAAENEAIACAAKAFGDIDATIQVRNEARIHLWYEAKFGVACPPYRSTRQGAHRPVRECGPAPTLCWRRRRSMRRRPGAGSSSGRSSPSCHGRLPPSRSGTGSRATASPYRNDQRTVLDSQRLLAWRPTSPAISYLALLGCEHGAPSPASTRSSGWSNSVEVSGSVGSRNERP
jgi:hypothetical protein